MALQYLFASASGAPTSQLDANFQTVGLLAVLPCSVTGTNSLALTLLNASNSPAVSGYANYNRFSFVASNTSTGAVTAAVGGLSSLNVYKNSPGGPIAVVANDIIAGNEYVLVYDSALNTGAGGFHLDFATATPVSTSAALDATLGSAQGDIGYRNATVWTGLAPGTAGQQLTTNGSGANPQWGGTFGLGLVAAGTTTSLATVMTAVFNEFTTVGSGLGGRLPAITGTLLMVKNKGANTLNVYPPIGAQIDALGTNTATTIATLGVGGYYAPNATQVYTVFTH